MNYMRASALFMPLKATEEQCGSLFFTAVSEKSFFVLRHRAAAHFSRVGHFYDHSGAFGATT